jgi:hypothetical protein
VTLHTTPDFDWTAVSWGGPDEVVAEECSYCDAPLREDDLALIMFTDNGWCARFCEACQVKYWGFEIIVSRDPEDEA